MPYDVIVVGGSYAGLSAALQLVRARRHVLLVDAGHPRNRFAKTSHGFLGQDGKAPFDILQDATRQVRAYPTFSLIKGQSLSVRGTSGNFSLTLVDGQEVQAARLILATGLRDELPLVAGLQERWGVTVVLCPYCHGYEVSGRPLGVLANHPMSAHQAVLILDWGPTTYFTQGVFEPDEEHASLFTARGVIVERTPVVELLGSPPALDAVRLADGRIVAVATLFTVTKTHMASPLAEQLGCALNDGFVGPFIRTDEWKQTTVPGVFAAGDAASPLHVSSLASASGVMAGVGAHQSLVAEGATLAAALGTNDQTGIPTPVV